MKPEFIGLQPELKRLDALWNRGRAQLMFLYGRRRVGKTALLVEWISRSGSRACTGSLPPTFTAAQLCAFLQAVYKFSHPGSKFPEYFTYASWGQAFKEIARLAQEQKLALLIDEYEAIHDDRKVMAKLVEEKAS